MRQLDLGSAEGPPCELVRASFAPNWEFATHSVAGGFCRRSWLTNPYGSVTRHLVEPSRARARLRPRDQCPPQIAGGENHRRTLSPIDGHSFLETGGKLVRG